MSLFHSVDVPCPACDEKVPFDMVFSVNASRAPHLRDAILNGTFQSKSCPKCNKLFRVQPEFNYLDIERDLWIAAFPLNYRSEWRTHEAHADEVFEKAFGRNSPAAALDMGQNLRRRTTFGWGALLEKIIVLEKGLDDVTVELCKLAIIRGVNNQPMANETELRLFAFEGDDFVMGWIESTTDRLLEQLQAPRSLYDEIEADREGWQELRNQLSEGTFVDLDRLLIESNVTAAPLEANA